jgi:hypothetical protein
MSLITADVIAQVAVSSSSSAVAAYLNTEITREKKNNHGRDGSSKTIFKLS